MWTTLIWFSFCIVSSLCTHDAFHRTLEERNHLLQQGLHIMLGSEIMLSDNEEKANKIIMDLKEQDIDYWFGMPQYFNFSKHFFEYREEVMKTELFKIIKKMPKGALLHIHDTLVLSPDYIVSLTYWDNLFICFKENNFQFMFSAQTPNKPCSTEWQLVRDARDSSTDVAKFDAELRKHFTLAVDNPRAVYTDINAMWKIFRQYFISTMSLLTYKPVWEQYFYDALLSFRKDNIMYVEMRSSLPTLYDLDGTVYDIMETAASYKKVCDQFMNDYPDFLGAKLIYAASKPAAGDNETVKEYINTARKLKKTYPNFFLGFDLVGQEDLGPPLKNYLYELSDANKDLNYFFHSGETDWFGTSSDENLIDAVALNSRRIGNAYAIIKYPVLIEKIKKKGIAIEANVIANHVETLVQDVRNHPLAAFLAHNIPVVISSDIPGVLEAEPLTHDFYVTFMGVAGRRADLRLLKQLARNSLYYSEYPDKDTIMQEFEIRWSSFIDETINEN